MLFCSAISPARPSEINLANISKLIPACESLLPPAVFAPIGAGCALTFSPDSTSRLASARSLS